MIQGLPTKPRSSIRSRRVSSFQIKKGLLHEERGFARSVPVGLLVLLTLFLTFIYTCFSSLRVEQQPIRVVTPICPKPEIPREPEPAMVQPEQPVAVAIPFAPFRKAIVEEMVREVKPLPPPVHLISLPVIKPIERVVLTPAPGFRTPDV